MTANLESSAVATEPEKSGFIPVPKKNNDKIVQITAQLHSFHMPARLCSKSFKLGFISRWTANFQMYKMGLEKAEDPKIKLPTTTGSQKKQGN